MGAVFADRYTPTEIRRSVGITSIIERERNCIGKWQAIFLITFDDGEFKWLTEEEASNIDNYAPKMYATIMDFMPDGTVRFMMKIPEEMSQEKINEAIADGCERGGDYFIIEKSAKRGGRKDSVQLWGAWGMLR